MRDLLQLLLLVSPSDALLAPEFLCSDCDVFIHEKLRFCPGCSQRETLMRQKLPLPAKRVVEILPAAHPDAKLMNQIVAAEARRSVRLVE